LILRRRLAFALSAACVALPATAAIAPRPQVVTGVPAKKIALNERISKVRAAVVALEQSLIDTLQSDRKAKESLAKIQELMRLQREERELSRSRMKELGETVKDLESRRGVIRERVNLERDAIRKSLRELALGDQALPESREAIEAESFEQPRAQLIRRMVQQGVREIDALRADLDDADRLETRIATEKGDLEATIHEMAESAGILELNRQLQIDLIQRNHADRVSQLQRWRKLKAADAQVSDLIQDFNARMELQESSRAERASRKATAMMETSTFGKMKGRLGLPLQGRILTRFGKAFDPGSGLNVFKKGVDIAAAASSEIRAISPGKIVFAGEMPSYGRLAIVDHGDHFYSICGHLGEIGKKVGESVEQGEKIGVSDSSGNPVYFEIRARNIPVDPLQWVSASL
jgi:septal ring factor EnvC (AmiA/AmiB activator)